MDVSMYQIKLQQQWFESSLFRFESCSLFILAESKKRCDGCAITTVVGRSQVLCQQPTAQLSKLETFGSGSQSTGCPHQVFWRNTLATCWGRIIRKHSFWDNTSNSNRKCHMKSNPFRETLKMISKIYQGCHGPSTKPWNQPKGPAMLQASWLQFCNIIPYDCRLTQVPYFPVGMGHHGLDLTSANGCFDSAKFEKRASCKSLRFYTWLFYQRLLCRIIRQVPFVYLFTLAKSQQRQYLLECQFALVWFFLRRNSQDFACWVEVQCKLPKAPLLSSYTLLKKRIMVYLYFYLHLYLRIPVSLDPYCHI